MCFSVSFILFMQEVEEDSVDEEDFFGGPGINEVWLLQCGYM